ncbi:MAG: PAS domain S-box protein [Bacteroidota bacterium]|nr:PAS domain S-box protein [Bacteroidota bacterium]
MDKIKLPRLLKFYEDSDFVSQQRAKFVFYLCVLLLCIIPLLILFRLITHPLSNITDKSHITVLLPLTIGWAAVFSCFRLLIKGHYNLSAHLIPVLVMMVTWLIVIFEQDTLLIRLDTVVYVFAAMAMVPLLVGKRKYSILLYSAVNIGILLLFIVAFRTDLGLSNKEFWDYLIDVSVSFAFMGIVGYNIYSINKNAQDRVQKDIERRKEIEKALIESERKFREMTEFLPQTVYESDLNGRLSYVNRSGYQHFGYTEEDVVMGLSIWSVIDTEDHLRVQEIIQKLLKGETSQRNHYSARKKDGSVIQVEIYTSVITENEVPVGLRGIIVDVTDRVKAEEDLRQSRELFRTLVERAPIPITLSSLEGRFIMTNKAFNKALGMPSELIIGKKPSELGLRVKEAGEEIIKDLLISSGHVDNIEITYADRNGEDVNLYVSANIVELNGQKVVLRTNIDVTEKKKTEHELQNYRNHLELLVRERTEELASVIKKLQASNDELNKERENLEQTLKKLKEAQEQLVQTEKMASLGILIAGVAHEINNPINYIYNGAAIIDNFIKEKYADDYNELVPYFDAINTGISRTTGIVKSLSRYSRSDDLPFVECNIHEVIEDCLTILYNQYKNRIEVQKDYEAGIPKVLINEGKIHQALLNILVNAIQAIPEEGIIKIQTSLENKSVSIAISDTGPGIKEDDLKYIFDPFFTTKEPGKGTGLGLSIALRIICEHSGTIQCFSKVNEGTRFIITLPCF